MWAEAWAAGSSEWRRPAAWHHHALKPQLFSHTHGGPLTSPHPRAAITHSPVNQSFSEAFEGLIASPLAPGSRQYPVSHCAGLGRRARPGRPVPPSVCMAALSCLSILEWGGIPLLCWGTGDNGPAALSKHRPADNLTHSRIPEWARPAAAPWPPPP